MSVCGNQFLQFKSRENKLKNKYLKYAVTSIMQAHPNRPTLSNALLQEF